MCGAKAMHGRRPDMPEALYQKILDDLAPHHEQIESLMLFMDGEPLLDKRLPIFIRKAKEAGFSTVRIATNGMLLTGATADAILYSGLDSLIVSIDSLDPRTYAEIRVGGDLNRVIQNVKQFMALREAKQRLRPQVEARMIVMPQNQAEQNEYRAFWRGIVDDVLFHGLHNWGNVEHLTPPCSTDAVRCNWPFRSMVIYSDGRAGFCCLDYEGIYPLGDFSHQSLNEIWHGEAYQKLRKHMARSDMQFLTKCRKCNFASLQPLTPQHWKKLLFLNSTEDTCELFLEISRRGALMRTSRYSLPAHKTFTWGLFYQNDIEHVTIFRNDNDFLTRVKINPIQTYYDIVIS